MKIERIINGEKIIIELTSEELSKANAEFLMNFFESEITCKFKLEDDAEKIAKMAHNIYVEEEGLTEYEAIEEAVNEFISNYVTKHLIENFDYEEEIAQKISSDFLICEWDGEGLPDSDEIFHFLGK